MGRRYLAIGAGVAAVLGAGLLAAQDTASGSSSAPGFAEMAAMRPPTDEILARRILMTGINQNMDELLFMIEDPKTRMDPDEAIEHAGTISTMLLAFPHLFSPDTDIYSQELEREEAGLVSLSEPTVWTEYEAFYSEAQAAADTAYQLSRSKSLDDFVAGTKTLLNACNACHETYRRHFDPAFVVPDDLGPAPDAD